MFRNQLYDPSKDPERREYYLERSTSQRGIHIPVKRQKLLSTGSNFWFLYNSFYWQPFRSILCRVLMIVYSIWFMVETATLFKENLIYFNSLFLILIAIDGILVIWRRKGLEDRWCSLSIVFFICANSTPLWLLEITLSAISVKNIFNPEHITHLETHYRELTPSTVVLDESENRWLEQIDRNKHLSLLGMHEALFCLVLIVSRIFLPQATLTWSAISSQSEFAFNTIFDIYSTISLLRDARLNLPKYIWVLTFVVCNGSLFPIALNLFPDTDSLSESFPTRPLAISRLRQLTDNFYFRLCMQIVFADFPFLLLRLIILANLRYVRKEMYYLIAKQVIIIFCKLAVMIFDVCRHYMSEFTRDEIKRINEGDGALLSYTEDEKSKSKLS